MFVVAGQVVDELDLRDGSLLYRILSDLPDPILRIEVTTSDRGHEYLLLLSAASELRIWDLENRFFLAGVGLSTPARLGRAGGRGGPLPSLPPVAVWTASQAHGRCTLLFSRAGSAHAEALHVQRQVDKPGAHTVIAVLEAKGATSKASAVSSISVHPHPSLPLVALGTSDGIVSIFECPWLSDAEDALKEAEASPGVGGPPPPMTGAGDGDADEDGDRFDGDAPRKGAGGRPIAGAPAAPKRVEPTPSTASQSRLLFAAAVSPDVVAVHGRLRKQSTAAAIQAAVAAGQSPDSVPTDSYYDMVTALTWHATLPVLAGADGTGRIVVWKVGLVDGAHCVLAARDWCAPAVPDDSPRIITSLLFHASLPRLLSLAYSPQSPGFAPSIAAWCTGHESLPPLPCPVTPALAAQLEAAVSDPASAGVAHLTVQPSLLHGAGATGRSAPVVWVAGRAIPTVELASSSRESGGDGGDWEEGVSNGAPGTWQIGPDAALLRPLLRVGAPGVLHCSPVVEVTSAPRSWFVTGGEGEGQDIAAADLAGGKEGGGGSDDLYSGSLADFAARMAPVAGKSAAAPSVAAEASAALTALGLPRRSDPPSSCPHITTVLYVQSRLGLAHEPPTLVAALSLHARPMGVSTGTAADGALQRSKRLCWLPGNGPGGPLTPLSLSRSPSGRYILVKFAYLTEVAAEKVGGAAAAGEATAVSAFRHAVAHAASRRRAERVKGGRPETSPKLEPAGDSMHAGGYTISDEVGAKNGAFGGASETVLYVVVGPLSEEGEGGPEGPPFTALRGDIPVSLLASAVDVCLLIGDRLLTVTRPAWAACGGAASTEYTVLVEPLDEDKEAIAAAEAAEAAEAAAAREREKSKGIGAAIKANAEKDFAKIKAGFDSLGETMKANAEKDLARLQSFFGVKGGAGAKGAEKDGAPAASHPHGHEETAADGAAAPAAATAPSVPLPSYRRAPIVFAVHEPVVRVYPTPFAPPRAAELELEGGEGAPARAAFTGDHPAAGEVMMYATRWRAPEDGTEDGPQGERVVLRYSNNAFGEYDESNPHGLAIVDAFTPTQPPSAAPTWRERHTTQAQPIGFAAPARERAGSGQAEGSGRPRSGTLVKQNSQSSIASGAHPSDAWAEHEAQSARCPVSIRPALVLGPGESIVKLTWQAGEGMWGDAGSHDQAAESVVGVKAGMAQPAKPVGLALPPRGSGLKGPSLPAPSTAPKHVTLPMPLTLPLALAMGGPLLSVLTTHRLLIVNPALQLLVAIPILSPVGAAVGAGLGHASTPLSHETGPTASALSAAHFGVWRGMFAPPHGHGQGYGAWALSGRDGGEGGTFVALGAGYVGTIRQEARVEGGATYHGRPAPGPAVLAVQARAAAPALPIASPLFGLPPHGMGPADGSATFVGGIQAVSIASAAASAERMTSPLPATRLSDTIPHDDASDEVVCATRWTSPIVSHAWVGSALAITTGSGEVWYVTPLGRARRAAALEPWMRDATLIAVLPDRLLFAASHVGTGRLQVRTRAFSPLEPLVAATLDHSITRPRPLLATLGAAGHAAGQANEPVAHPIVAALSHTLSMSLLVYRPGDGKGKEGKGTTASLVSLTGQAAIAGLGLAALARDYSFVRDAVVRYSHPLRDVEGGRGKRDGPGSGWGVTRTVVAALEERGLLDLAFYATQGNPRGADRAKAGAPGGGAASSSAAAGGAEVEEAHAAWAPWLDESGQRKRGATLPWHWRASLGLKRGRFDHAVWSLAGEDPALASALVLLSKGASGGGSGLDALAEYDPATVRLPSPHSPLAARFRVLGRVLASAGHLRGALLCFDIAGDYSAALAVLCLASATAVISVAREGALRRKASLDDDEDEGSTAESGGVEGSLRLAEVDAALGALLGPSKERYPALALASAMHRKAVADDGPAVVARDRAARAAARLARTNGSSSADSVGEEGEEEEEGEGEEERRAGSLTSSLLDAVRGEVYLSGGESRTARGEALLPVDYAIGASAPAVAAHARRMLETKPLTAAPALASCPYISLIDGTLAAVLAAGEEAGRRRGHRGTGGALGLRLPAPLAVVHASMALAGGSVDPLPSDPLPSRHAPTALDSVQRWLGSAVPVPMRGMGSAAGAGAEGEEEEGEGGLFGLSLEGLLGKGAGEKEADPVEAAHLSAQGKRKLKALPRGAEDAVVGYWRFERGDAEVAGEAARGKGKGGKGWGFTNGASPEPLSPWHAAPVSDLSRQAAHGSVLDATFTLARAKGVGVAAKEAAPALVGVVGEGAGAGGLQPFLRLGWGACDAPFDPGDPSKVREPRVLVAGVGTLEESGGGKVSTVVKGVPRIPLHRLLQADSVAGGGPAGLAPSPFPPSLALLSSLHSWAVAVPVPRFSYSDIGVRAWDGATAAWTWEAWVKVGNAHAGAGGHVRGGEEGDSASSLGISLARDVVLVSRVEEVGGHLSTQWRLAVRPDGCLVFETFPGGGGASSPASAASPRPSTVSSTPSALSLGEWRHVAVVVDSSGAAKEVAARVKGAGVSGEPPSDSPLPPTTLRMFVDSVQVGEGSVESGLPLSLPPSPAPLPLDMLLIAPDFVGRMAEVRLWAKKRGPADLSDTRDFHLDLAESGRKARMAITIRPATLPLPGAGEVKVEAPLVEAPVRKLGGGALALAPGAAGGGRRRPAGAAAPAAEAATPPAPEPAADGDEFDAGFAPTPAPAPAPPAPAEEEAAPPVRKLGAGGPSRVGLGAPPSGVGGGRKAAMLKAAAQSGTKGPE